jgi:hypothetical protein
VRAPVWWRSLPPRWRTTRRICCSASIRIGGRSATGWPEPWYSDRSYYTCPNRSYRGQLSSTLWVSRSSTTTFSGGVSVGGIGVDAKQTNTSSHKKSYVPKRSGAYICGQNGNPTSTEKVSETS